jgi:small basic protein (TIGR04137 family)
MTQHSSLKSGGFRGKQRRNVLKRSERIKILRDKGKLKEDDKVYGLPKVKPEG